VSATGGWLSEVRAVRMGMGLGREDGWAQSSGPDAWQLLPV
jgi:hypothetical protein